MKRPVKSAKTHEYTQFLGELNSSVSPPWLALMRRVP